MKARTGALFVALAATLTACGGEVGAAGRGLDTVAAAASIERLLGGITDAQSAAAARTQLEPWIAKLDSGLVALQEAAAATGGQFAEWRDQAMAVVGPQLDRALASLRTKVDALRADPQIREALGTVLDDLARLLAK
jgi:hypothetical protein